MKKHTITPIIFLLLMLTLFSCKEKGLTAEFIQNDFMKGEDAKIHMKHHSAREKAGELGKMESGVLARFPVQYSPYVRSNIATIDLDGKPLQNEMTYDFTIPASEGDVNAADKIIYVSLKDLNGDPNSVISTIGKIMKDPKIKSKKVFDIDTFSNCFGIEYLEASLMGVQDLNAVAFLYDRFILSMWSQGNSVNIQDMKGIALETARILSPYRSHAFPVISIKELPGAWTVSGAEITDEFVNKNSNELMRLLSPDLKQTFINDINKNIVGKLTYTFEKNNIVYLKIEGVEKAKGAFEIKKDTVYFNVEGIDNKMFTYNKDTWVIETNKQSIPIYYLKKSE